MYEYGLRTCYGSPQVFKLSHILASYRKGKIPGSKISIIVEDKNIKSDGELNFNVPERLKAKPKFLCRLKLAWKVFRGKADILFYE